tara:strand:- start:3326 stop:4069 length:744 start_codon:yes stop_codon:yes gene_type:complete
MKRNLLDMVQEIQSDLDLDEIESIDDTMESEQIVVILKATYYSMMSNRNWPHLRRSIQIEPYSDVTKPTHMKIQDEIKELCFLNYNKANASDTRKKYEGIKYLQPDEFIHKTNQNDDSQPTVTTVQDPGGVELFVRNDRAPTYYTSFDDSTLVFDSYDSGVDSSLQQSKVQAQAYVIPAWTSSDTFIPDLPDDAFTALVEEAKSRSSLRLRQVADQKAEQESGKQNRWLARKARRVSGGIQYPNYGR